MLNFKIFLSPILIVLLGVSSANAQVQPQTQHASQPQQTTYALPASFADIVENAMPAVVNISTTQSIEMKNPFDELRVEIPEGSPFEQLFKDFLERDFGGPRKRKATSLGSGFIIDPDGYVATNYHVIENADEVTVTLSSDPDKNYPAKVIGVDKRTDLALLKINVKQKLPFLKFGSSDQSRVGDWIIAIGNPFGLGGTVTAGIISAKARFISGQYDEFIQTDASINKGNSGGPMINMAKEVIGINSVIISPSGMNIGLGFAIPSGQAEPILKQLREKGQITRGWLGVGIQPLTEEMAKNFGVEANKGVVVSEVVKDSPADKAGVKLGDIILSFDGNPINQPVKLSKNVAETPVGKQSMLEILRDGKPLKLDVKVAKLESKAEDIIQVKPEGNQQDSKVNDYHLGMKLDNIDPTLRQRFKIDPGISGVVVSRVSRNTPAGDLGVKAGDVIMQINKVKITNVADAAAEIKRATTSGAKNIVLLISRGGSNRFVVMDLE